MMTERTNDLFQSGAAWLRADFHLHTKADREFCFSGEESYYINNYINSLEQAGIKIGVITNHNKFDKDEFKNLNKVARNRNIFLLPGVELSVNDGSNGVHVLIIFSEQWLERGDDYINPFISSMFTGRTPQQYQNKNGLSDKNILQTVEELNKIGRDYFLIFAHVEESKGLWNGTEGGKFLEWNEDRYKVVKERTLGFQKVRTHDKPDCICRMNVQKWLKNAYPAEVEGSDPKKLDEIGRGESCFLKIGAFTFDAVKFALADYASRVAKQVPEYQHSHIKSISFEGGIFAGKTIHFSPELNTLIGIRGSGKSAVLEVLRYVLDIPFGEKAGDRKYKEDLVKFALGSGGKAIIESVDRYDQHYEIHRIWNESSSVYIDGVFHSGISIRETVLRKPIYFGQKDLSNTGDGFEKDLIVKLLGAKLDEVRRKIAGQKVAVEEAIDRLLKINHAADQLEEQDKIRQDTEYRLKLYKEHGVEEKLQKRLDFDADLSAMKRGIDLAGNFIAGTKELIALHEDDLSNFIGYSSKQNAELFVAFFASYAKVIEEIDLIRSGLNKAESAKDELLARQHELILCRKNLADEFAETERKLAEELRSNGSQCVSSEEFLELKQKLAQAVQLLENFSKQGELKNAASLSLRQELQKLNELWHEEFRLIKEELDKVNKITSSLNISIGYKEDKNCLLEFMKSIFKGSHIRENTFNTLSEKYQDIISMYHNMETEELGSSKQTFIEYFNKNLKILLTYQTPNRFSITYQGKGLQHHSLGQRASALILFVLTRHENDVVIIDQPEDDLDNQTVYEDVIKLVRKMKPQVQFIFSTHNPNIPVLGDAEQVLTCSFVDNSASVQSGGIDNPAQQEIIVEIMEGGKEAFNQRKKIYQIWKH